MKILHICIIGLVATLFVIGVYSLIHTYSQPKAKQAIMIALESEDYLRASTLLFKEAQQGKDPFNQFAYAELLKMGLVPGVKPEQAIEFYKKAAASGYRPALISLLVIAPTIGDFSATDETAARLMHIRAIGGDPEGCLDLAVWYHEHKEEDQSRYWLIRSTDKIDKYNVYKAYRAAQILFSEGTGQNQRKAIEIMRDLATRGNGYFELAKMLETADDITLRNPSEAIDYYLKAAADGNAKAQLRVGVYFFEAGSGYDALRYFKKAVEPRKNDRGYGYIPTGSRLALMYYLGRGMDGFQGYMEESSITESELKIAIDENDFQNIYYAVAIALRNAKYDFALKEAAAAAENGKQNCKVTSCLAMTALFQVLSGQSDEVLRNADKLNSGNAMSHFHLGHALLLNDRTAEALDQYSKGLSQATFHEKNVLDEELEVMSWQYSRKHLLIAATRLTLNKETNLFAEETILRHEEIKALKSQMVKDGMLKEIEP